MNILCLSNMGPSAATSVLRLRPMMREMQARGHNVTFVMNPREETDRHYPMPAYIGIRLYDIIREASRSGTFDVIFASKPSAALLGFLISKRTGTPLVFDQDDLEGLLPVRPFFWRTSIGLARKADKFIVASHWLAKSYSAIRKDTAYIPNGVDLDVFDPSNYPSCDPSLQNILWVSPESLERELEFVKETLRLCPDARLIVMGKGGKRLLSENLPLDPDLRKRIEVKEWIPAADVPSVYSQCSVALLPYPDDLWYKCKCPTKLLEFIAMEIPFVATVGEPAYMASRFGCGVVAAPSPRDFALRTRLLLSNLDEVKRNAWHARGHLVEFQNFGTLGDRLEDVLIEANEST